jgi:signal transduction histidine kinase
MMVTQVSCKITNSLLTHFERQGVSQGPLFEIFDGPEEFLRDPHFWLSVAQVEKLFEKAARIFSDPNIAQVVATQVVEFQTWGALDSVFKMMPKPEDYYTNLGRFFSYFLAPLEDFKETERGDTFVRFQFPIEYETAPHIFDFLRTTLENLPRYTGHPPLLSDWSELKKEMWISWDTAQPSLFDVEPGQVLNPRLIQHLQSTLESNEKQLEAKNRVIMQQQDELVRLRSELQTQVREKIYAEKMTGLAQLAAGVAHEINNPLSFVMSNLGRFEEYFQRLHGYLKELEHKILIKDPTAPQWLQELKEQLDVDFVITETPGMLIEASEGLTRVKEIVKDLSSLAHPRTGSEEKKIPTDINSIIESAIKVFHDELGERIHVEKQLELKAPVRVFPVRISQVFMNLLSNAVHAIPQHGIIEVKTNQNENEAIIEIADNGMGMDDSVMARIFTPFFTTKEVGKGTGLGLSIAQSIVEMHKGRIDVKSEKGRGSRFIVTLPLNDTHLDGGSQHV